MALANQTSGIALFVYFSDRKEVVELINETVEDHPIF
jgi:hypothetical protein